MKNFTCCSYLLKTHLSRQMKSALSLFVAITLFFFGNVNALNLNSKGLAASNGDVYGVNAELSIWVDNVVDVSCSGLGSIKVSATGGTQPYEFSLDGDTYFPTADTTFTFANMYVGDYTVWVRDGDGTTTSVPASVAVYAPTPQVLNRYNNATMDITVTDAVCANLTGTVDVSCNVKTYLWIVDENDSVVYSDNGNSSRYLKDKTVQLKPGEYTFVDRVTSPACTTYKKVTVNGPAELQATIGDVTDVNSCGTILGTALVTATGGSAPYIVKIENDTFPTTIDEDGGNVTITGLAVGANNVSVIDACGTEFSLGSVEVSQNPNMMTLAVSAVDDDGNDVDGICLGTSVNLRVYVENGSGEYEYAWQGANAVGGIAFSTGINDTAASLPKATPDTEQVYYYFVKVVDSEGCEATSDTADITITVRKVIDIISVTPVNQVLCTGATTDTIAVSVPFVTPDASIFWRHSNASVSSAIDEENEFALTDTIYYIDKFAVENHTNEIMYDTITIWTINGVCESQSAQVVIEVQPQHEITIVQSRFSQCAETEFVIEHGLSNGATDMNVAWEGDNDPGLVAENNGGIYTLSGTLSEAGTYVAVLTTTGEGACTASVSDTVVVRELPVMNVNNFSNTFCDTYGENGEDIVISINIEDPDRVVWTLPAGEIIDDINPLEIAGVFIQDDPDYYVGVYSVEVEQEGCVATSSTEVAIDCNLMPGATTITVEDADGTNEYEGIGLDPYVSGTFTYSDELTITFSDPVKTKYVSDNCPIEYRINDGEWTVWSDPSTPVVLTSDDIKIGLLTFDMKHSDTCSDEYTYPRQYLFTIEGNGDLLDYGTNIDEGEICISDTTLFLNNINIAGFDTNNNRYEWAYEYNLVNNGSYSGDWTPFSNDYTPALPVNTVLGEDIATEPGDEISIAIRVSYILYISGSDTVWESSVESDYVTWTLRAVSDLSATDTTICVTEPVTIVASFTEEDDPTIAWYYSIGGSNVYTELDNDETEARYSVDSLLFNYHVGRIEPGGSDFYLSGFNGAFNNISFVAAITSANPTCPVVYDTIEVNLKYNNEITLLTANDTQSICANGEIEVIKYHYGVDVDSVVVNWDVEPTGITVNVDEDTITISGNAEIGEYNYTITVYGLCEPVEATGYIKINELPEFPVQVLRPASCETAVDAQVVIAIPSVDYADVYTHHNLILYDAEHNSYVGKRYTGIPYGHCFNRDFDQALGAGTYYLEITNKETQCVYRDTITVGVSDTALTANYNNADALCNGASDGEVTITPIYGNGNNTVTLYDINGVVYDSASNVQIGTSVTFDTLKAGKYYFVVDDNACQFHSDTFTIGEPDTIEVELVLDAEIECAGRPEGALLLYANGGTPDYTIEWFVDGEDEPFAQDIADVDGLLAGTYRASVSDANGCRPGVATITITQPDTIKFAFADTACNEYIWNSQIYDSTDSYVQVFPAANGCDSVVTLNLVINKTQYGDTTIIACTQEVEYHGKTYDHAGEYKDTLTASNTCDSVLTIHVVMPEDLLDVVLEPTNVTCHNAHNGQLAITVTGGIPRLDANSTPYYRCEVFANGNMDEAVLSNDIPVSSMPAEISGLDTGAYVVVITDSICNAQANTTITQPMPLVSAMLSEDAAICHQVANASATVQVAGGTPNANGEYTYEWYDSLNVKIDGADSEVLENVLAGRYTVVITDSMGCSVTDTANLADAQPVIEELDIDACYKYEWEGEILDSTGVYEKVSSVQSVNGCDSTVILNITIHTPVYDTVSVKLCGTSADNSYEWITAEDIHHTCTETGYYFDTVPDIYGCDWKIHVLNLVITADTLDLAVEVSDVMCNGGNDGALSLNVTGAGAPYLAVLSTNDSIKDMEADTEYLFEDLTAGVYTVTLYSADGQCFVSSVDTIKQPAALSLTIDSTRIVTCYGGSDGYMAVVAAGGVAPYLFEWEDENHQTLNGFGSDSLSYSSDQIAGTYTVTVFDDNECSTSVQIVLGQNDSIITYDRVYGCYSYIYEWEDYMEGEMEEEYTVSCDTVHHVLSSKGCDSLVYLHVDIYTPVYDTTYVKLCGTYDDNTYTWVTPEGREYTLAEEGYYTDTVVSTLDCDSLIHVLRLTIPTDTMVVAIDPWDVDCFGGNNGGISVAILGGGVEPYRVYLSNGDSITDLHATADGYMFENLTAGAYTITVIDSTPDRICRVVLTDTVRQPDSLYIVVVSATNIDCNGGLTGFAEVTTNIDPEIYDYVWYGADSAIVMEGTTLGDAAAGTYTVVATDPELGCSASTVITLTEPDVIKNSITVAACDSFRWEEGDGMLYTVTDTVDYTFEGGAANGCDSIVTLYVFIGNSSDAVPAVCPSDVAFIAPYGVCEVATADLNLGVPTYAAAEDSATVNFYNDAPEFLTVGNTYTITWTSEYTCGETNHCTQVVTINFPPCGYDTEDSTMFYVYDAEGNQYSTVRLGCDCWMAENLTSTVYSDTICMTPGDAISFATVYNSQMYSDSASNLAKYGRLYDWNSAAGLPAGSTSAEPCLNAQNHIVGVCPIGWYLPTAEDYQNAYNAAGPGALMAEDGWINGNGGNNASGFGVVPGGYFNAQAGEYYNLLGNAYFWTSSMVNPLYPSACEFRFACPAPEITTSERGNGMSIRCVKEYQEMPKISTYAVSALTDTSVVFSGEVFTDGGEEITEYGFVWNTTGNPTKNDNKIALGSGIAPFSTSVDTLTKGTTYYVCAYAVNSMVTVYGATVSFTTWNVPTLSSLTIGNVNGMSAVVSGSIAYDGGTPVTAYGICWNTDGFPTVEDDTMMLGEGSESFTTTINELDRLTTYFVRSFAINSVGMSYSDTVSFTTTALLPFISSAALNNITSESVVAGGQLSDDGGAFVTEKGVCFNTTGNPTIADSVVVMGDSIGDFSGIVSGLTEATVYYIAAYATNAIGTAYGEVAEFKTLAIKPVVSALTIDTVTGTTATVSSAVTYDGGDSVTERGVCYTMSGTPTIADSKFVLGSDTGSFSGTIIELEPAHTYFAATYATNSIGTSYSSTVSFTTAAVLPTVITTAADSVTETSAIVGGEVVADGGAFVTERGVCYSISDTLPTIADSVFVLGDSLGQFAAMLSSLADSTTYYLRAYATNMVGTAYGEAISFTTLAQEPEPFQCGTSTVTDVDGNEYHTLILGNQCWLKENLRTTHYRDESEIDVESYFAPGNNNGNVPKYGYLYTWDVVNMDTVTDKGLCPEGWHVSSYDEWMQIYLDEDDLCSPELGYVAKALASNGMEWEEFYMDDDCAISKNQGNNNATGFTALPAGIAYSSVPQYFNVEAHFWTSTQIDNEYAYSSKLWNYSGALVIEEENKTNALSVRCVKDAEEEEEEEEAFNCGTSTVTDVDGNEYHTLLLGNQCWMRENLKTERLADADTTEIGEALAPSHDQPSFYYPDQSQDNVDAYGLLYNFAAVATGNLCPTGWHVPSDSEWTVLSDYVASVDGYGCGGYPTYTGKALASTEGWYEYAGDCSVGNQQSDNNATGFNMMPAGYFHQNSGYTNFSKQARFWTSIEDEDDPDYSAYNRSLYYFNSYLQSADNSFKSSGMSVRCVKDDEPQAFECGDDIEDVEGNTYGTLLLGNQCWMRENLRTRTFDDGGSIASIEQVGWIPTADDAVFYSVDNDPGYDDSFGLLYNFPAVDAGNLCPAGWHVPSNDDWTVLAGYVSSVPEYVCDIDNSGSIARALASKYGWSNVAPGFCNPMELPQNNNATGFTAMPAGSFESDPLDEPLGSFFSNGVGAYFWTSSSSSSSSGDSAFSYVLSTTPDLMSGISSKSSAFSVRCLKDE